jgi:hypothetical protein
MPLRIASDPPPHFLQAYVLLAHFAFLHARWVRLFTIQSSSPTPPVADDVFPYPLTFVDESIV